MPMNAIDNDKAYVSANGIEIILTKEKEKHLQCHSDVFEFLEEAISKTDIPDGAIRFEKAVNLGRTVGKSLLVEAEKIFPDDEADFVLRTGREWPVRVNIESKGVLCDSVTLEIKFDEITNKYFLNTAYIGYPCPDSPYHVRDKKSPEYKESLDFWCSHALAYDPKIMKKPFKSTWNSVLNKIRK